MRVEGGNVSPKSLLEDKRILIVDDEPDVLDVLEELLSMCHLKRASSFEEANKTVKEFFYPVLFCKT